VAVCAIASDILVCGESPAPQPAVAPALPSIGTVEVLLGEPATEATGAEAAAASAAIVLRPPTRTATPSFAGPTTDLPIEGTADAALSPQPLLADGPTTDPVVAESSAPQNAADSHPKLPDEASALQLAPSPPFMLQVDVSSAVPAIQSEPVDTASNPGAASDTSATEAVQSATETTSRPTDSATQPTGTTNEGQSIKAPSFVLPGRGAARASSASPLSEIERARLVQRVARAVETAGEGGQMRLRLSPPELGSLRLEVSVRQGLMTAHIEAETPQARLLLLDNLPALRDRLQEQNVKIERFDVDLMNQPGGGQPQGYRQRDEQHSEEPAYPPGAPAGEATSIVEARPAVARRLGGGEQLNVVI
jgi:flagellar hook-length control protein FliK